MQVRRRKRGAALLMTLSFFMAQVCLVFAGVSLLLLFAPGESARTFFEMLFDPDSDFFEASTAVAFAIVLAFLEPFYVAAGFAMYLNRRAELEAWDVEQELRRAFAS